MNTNNNKLLKRVFNLFTTREKEIINHPADKDFEYKIEEIQKQININLQNLLVTMSPHIKVYIMHNHKEIILDEPDEIFISQESGAIIDSECVWSLHMDTFTYRIGDSEIDSNNNSFRITLIFFKQKPSGRDIRLEIKGKIN